MKGAIFDMDGLLLDSEQLYQRVWREMAAELGQELDDSFAAAICGSGDRESEEILLRYLPMVEPRPFINECTRRVTALEENELPLKPGVFEILEGLTVVGAKIAVASSSPMEMVQKNLAKVGLAAYFHVFVSGKDVQHGKPNPDIFLLAAERLGLPPETCYVFEDSRNGILAADRAGCKPIMIPDLVQPDARLRELCQVWPDLAAAWNGIRETFEYSM